MVATRGVPTLFCLDNERPWLKRYGLGDPAWGLSAAGRGLVEESWLGHAWGPWLRDSLGYHTPRQHRR